MVSCILPCVLHFEVEPLLVALGVRVHLTEQIVLLDLFQEFAVTELDVVLIQWVGFDSLQVATFECGVKLEVLLVLELPFFLFLGYVAE